MVDFVPEIISIQPVDLLQAFHRFFRLFYANLTTVNHPTKIVDCYLYFLLAQSTSIVSCIIMKYLFKWPHHFPSFFFDLFLW